MALKFKSIPVWMDLEKIRNTTPPLTPSDSVYLITVISAIGFCNVNICGLIFWRIRALKELNFTVRVFQDDSCFSCCGIRAKKLPYAVLHARVCVV